MTDYISREAVFSAIWKTSAEHDVFFPAIILDAIKSIPAADVRPVKRGKWTDAIVSAPNLYDRLGMMASMHGYVCNCCQDFSVARYDFCPNCGADMREES